MTIRATPSAVALAGCALLGGCAGMPPPAVLEGVPRYDHVFVILEENKDYDQIMSVAAAPHIATLATTYGDAARFYGETHPSEGNYVALLGGDNFGIHDDDAFYCKPGQRDPNCPHSARPDYVDHTRSTPASGRSAPARRPDLEGLSRELADAWVARLRGGGSLCCADRRPRAGLRFETFRFRQFRLGPERSRPRATPGRLRPLARRSGGEYPAELRVRGAQPVQRDARPSATGRRSRPTARSPTPAP